MKGYLHIEQSEEGEIFKGVELSLKPIETLHIHTALIRYAEDSNTAEIDRRDVQKMLEEFKTLLT